MEGIPEEYLALRNRGERSDPKRTKTDSISQQTSPSTFNTQGSQSFVTPMFPPQYDHT